MDGGSGPDPKSSRYRSDWPAVITQCRKARRSRALAAVGCLVLTTAYS